MNVKTSTPPKHASSAKGQSRAGWPKLLVECIEVVESALRRAGLHDDDSLKYSECVVLALSEFVGGERIYFPRPDGVRTALRDAQIWDQFDGRNILELAKRHGFSERQIYRILAKQRRLANHQRQVRLRQGSESRGESEGAW